MPTDINRARRICNERELTLVAAARSPMIGSLSAQRLRKNVVRTRDLRDKFRDLARRQHLEGRGKVSPRGTRRARSNVHTLEKAELFDEVLQRFEGRLAKLGGGGANAAAAPKPRRKRPTRKAPAGVRRATGSTTGGTATPLRPKGASAAKRAATARSARSERAGAEARSASTTRARKGAKLARSPVPRAKAHVTSRNRRDQARRDAR